MMYPMLKNKQGENCPLRCKQFSIHSILGVIPHEKSRYFVSMCYRSLG